MQGAFENSLSKGKYFASSLMALSNSLVQILEKSYLDIAFAYIWICVFLIPSGGNLPSLDTLRQILSLLFAVPTVLVWWRTKTQIKSGLGLIALALAMAAFVGFGRGNFDDAFRVLRLFSVFFFIAVMHAVPRPSSSFFLRNAWVIFLMTGLVLFLQLAVFRFYGPLIVFGFFVSGQTTFYNLDPNYTGFYMLLFMLAAYLFKRPFWILFSFIACNFIASRNFLVGILAFVSAAVLEILRGHFGKEEVVSTKKSPKVALLFLGMALGLNLISASLSELYPLFRQAVQKTQTYADIHQFTTLQMHHRFFSFMDNSNENRFARNRSFLSDITANPKVFMFGLDDYPDPNGMTIHHSIFDIAGNYGVPCALIFLCTIAFCIWWFQTPRLILIPLASLLVFGLFLAGVYQGKTWLFIFLATLLSPRLKSKEALKI